MSPGKDLYCEYKFEEFFEGLSTEQTLKQMKKRRVQRKAYKQYTKELFVTEMRNKAIKYVLNSVIQELN